MKKMKLTGKHLLVYLTIAQFPCVGLGLFAKSVGALGVADALFSVAIGFNLSYWYLRLKSFSIDE